MSRRLCVTDEVRDWLTDLRERDPSAARLAGDAVLGLLEETPGPPLVVPVDLLAWSEDPADALMHAYTRHLALRQKVRRDSTDIATARKRLELHIQQVEAEVRRLGDQIRMATEAGRHDVAQDFRTRQAGLEDVLPDLRRDHSDLAVDQERAALAEQRMERALAAWRARKEAVRLRHLVGRAQDRIDEALDEERPAGPGRPAHAATAEARSAVETFLDVERGLEHEHGGPAPGLQELRLGPLTGHDLRFLFAVAPSGTVHLLSAAEGPGTWHDQHVAITAAFLCGDPDPEEETGESFLREFFPDDAEERRAGAARLLARSRAHVLAGVRSRRGFTLERVAERMNVTRERVAEIESAEPDALQVGVLVAYLEAIGGRLEIVADLGTERVTLR